jgi:undecaprenyl-diphosphatase
MNDPSRPARKIDGEVDRQGDRVGRMSRRDRTAAIAAGVIVTTIAVVALSLDSTGPLTPFKAIVLGAVEGLTEYLPVSSTGHLLVTQRLLDLGEGDGKAAADTYAIAIQIGAILAVVVLYWRRLGQLAAGVVGRDADGRRLLLGLVVAFVPAAFVGLLLGDTIKERLFGPWPVVAAWLAGGIFLVWWDPRSGRTDLTGLTLRHTAIIGAAQILALWPGMSRSLVTIAAALAIGATMGAAVEFSFLLGLATLTAATLFDLAQGGGTLLDEYGWRTPLLGAVVAFVTAVIAVRWLVSFLRTRPLSIFGWYRIGIAATTAALIAAGTI